MSADFWAGYISGAAGIILGNPLDILKVRLQAGSASPSPSPSLSSGPRSAPTSASSGSYTRPFLLGTAAPVLGYGALNALLFMSYNRTEAFLNRHLPSVVVSSSAAAGGGGGGGAPGGRGMPDTHQGGKGPGGTSLLLSTWLAGAVGGLATWFVSTPTELVKCRAQLQRASPPPLTPTGTVTSASSSAGAGASSWLIAKQILRAEGLRGLYFGGGVTALRDSIGYGFYFWGYELCTRWMGGGTSSTATATGGGGVLSSEAARVLLCGGLAGIISWASIFPLDVIKTRVQTQAVDRADFAGERTPFVSTSTATAGGGVKARRLGAWEVAKETYREGGIRPFFRGLAVCSVRAFFVNAVQWAAYEWIMMELGHGRRRRDEEFGVVAV